MSDTKEKIDVMQAFIDGKIVEFCWRSEADKFMRLRYSAWNWKECDYRIKKEPEYIPFDFSDAELLRGKWVKQKDKSLSSCEEAITGIDTDGIYCSEYYTSFERLFEVFIFVDAKPCGKLKK